MAILKYKIYDSVDLNDKELTLFHREIIQRKAFLKKIYTSWYRYFQTVAVKNKSGSYVEIGSGGGFLKELITSVITSDIEDFDHCDMTFSALNMPFKEQSIEGIFMVNVFHHIPDAEIFLKEAKRVLKPGGSIIMTEPCITWWSRFIFKNLHHEPIDLKGNWTLKNAGRLSDANIALPWIVFQRDIEQFNSKFPELSVEKIIKHTPMAYLLSGGVSYKFSLPAWSFKLISYIEIFLLNISKSFSMFQTIIITKHSN